MSRKEAAEAVIARVFNTTRGNDLALGKMFTEDADVQRSWNELKDDKKAQKRFLKFFDAAHGHNQKVQDRIAYVMEMSETRNHKKLSRFQAIGFIIGAAQNAYWNGGPV